MAGLTEGRRESMLTKRIIPCLDVKDGRVVKGVKFQGLRDAGSPTELAKLYADQGADELVFLDISATNEGRMTHCQTVAAIRKVIGIPLTTGGGIREADDAGRLLDAGADKVSVNTSAFERPELLREIAERFGRQCSVLALDAARRVQGGPGEGSSHNCSPISYQWEVVTRSGAVRTGRDVVCWAKEAVEMGAGEILLTSWDRDGTRSGYDCELLRAISAAVSVPVIASGGAHSPQHMLEAFRSGADAVLAASIFHDGDWTIAGVKEELSKNGVEVRR